MKHLNNTNCARGLLLALIFRNDSRQSHQDNGQPDDRADKINYKHVVHNSILANNQRLINHKTVVATSPAIAAAILNLSNTAGKTTDANITTPVSDAISDNFWSWISDSFKGILSYNSGLPRVVNSYQNKWNQRLIGVLISVISAVLFANHADAGLIFGAPKYVGLNSGLRAFGGRNAGYWSFNGPGGFSTVALDTVSAFAIMVLLTPPVQSLGFRRGFVFVTRL